MHYHVGSWRPLTCSQCGSTNAVRPLNQRGVAVRCGDCGHTKLTPEAERRHRGDDDPFKGWSAEADPTPKF
jgi:DNA-directed RNA polymerase subunit RPC12/RpoP